MTAENVQQNASRDGVFSSTGGGNKKGRLDDLYVMRNAIGMIKVGRSGDPPRRRRDLELASGHAVSLLAVIQGQGAIERSVHAALEEYRREGEWFHPSMAFRLALCAAIGMDIRFPSEVQAPKQYVVDEARPLHPEEIAMEAEMQMRRAGKTEDDVNQMRVSLGLFPFETKAQARERRERPRREMTALIEAGLAKRAAALMAKDTPGPERE